MVKFVFASIVSVVFFALYVVGYVQGHNIGLAKNINADKCVQSLIDVEVKAIKAHSALRGCELTCGSIEEGLRDCERAYEHMREKIKEASNTCPTP